VREPPILLHAGVEPLADEPVNHSIAYPQAEHVPQVPTVDRVEELLDVDLHDPAAAHLHRRVAQRRQRAVRGAFRPETMRAVQKILLVHSVQHHRHRPLKDLILEGRNAKRTRPPVTLRDVHPPHGRCAVRPRLGAVEQRLEIFLQFRCVLFRALPVDALRSVLAGASVRLPQPVHVDVVGQRLQHHVGCLLGQLRYPFEFR